MIVGRFFLLLISKSVKHGMKMLRRVIILHQLAAHVHTLFGIVVGAFKRSHLVVVID